MEFDTFGNRLTEEQKEFFKGTKVKDGDRLMVCRHLTSSPEFKKFDIRKNKNSSDKGIGFYFSTDDSVYGAPKEGQRKIFCYLNIERLMTEDTHFVSGEQWRKFVDAAWEGEDLKPTNYFTFPDETPDAVNYKVISDVYGGDKAYFMECVRKYLPADGAFYKPNCVVAFRPDEIKFIDNKNPTDSEDMDEALDYLFEHF